MLPHDYIHILSSKATQVQGVNPPIIPFVTYQKPKGKPAMHFVSLLTKILYSKKKVTFYFIIAFEQGRGKLVSQEKLREPASAEFSCHKSLGLSVPHVQNEDVDSIITTISHKS